MGRTKPDPLQTPTMKKRVGTASSYSNHQFGLKKHKSKLPDESPFHMDEEPTDDFEKKRSDDFEKKFKRHGELLKNFTEAKTLDEAFKWMNRVDKFEQKHLRLRPKNIVIGELMNRLKGAKGKDKFLIQQKLNRAVRLVEWKEAYDPNNPGNYGVE